MCPGSSHPVLPQLSLEYIAIGNEKRPMLSNPREGDLRGDPVCLDRLNKLRVVNHPREFVNKDLTNACIQNVSFQPQEE